MQLTKFLKPTKFKLAVFIFIGIFYLYFAKESSCAVSLYFAFCYNAYGFPFLYMATGDIDAAPQQLNTFFFGKHFAKSGNILLNYATLLLDITTIYALACLIAGLFKKSKLKA